MEQYDEELMKIYRILSDRSYYSLGTEFLSTKTKIPLNRIKRLSWPTYYAGRFNELTGDIINIFTYNGVEYIGLETRRLDYERDKLAGINWVEDAIKRGDYG